MRRPVALRWLAGAATAAAGAAIVLTVPLTNASAAVIGAADGFAAGTTGGSGGPTVRVSTGTGLHQALCGRSSTSAPITIEVEGTINHGNTSKVSGSCSTAADVIELKGISNVSIIGVGSGATFDQLGIHIRDSSNIIIQNVTVKNVKKSGSPTSNGGDAIGMESTVRKVWVDHVTLEASGGESAGFDGLFDMKNDVENVTLSYSKLRNSGRGGLIGSSESDTGSGNITFHHNLYENIDSRTPLLRGGVAHVYNNYFNKLNESGINSRAGAKAKVENNYFKDAKDVLGTFYTSERGTWQTSGNILDNVTWSSPGTDAYPAGPSMASTTTVSLPYSARLDSGSCVPSVVSATAGANTGVKVSNGSCTVTAPPTTGGPTASPSAGPTASPSTGPTGQPSGTNLSLSAGADGSSKASGSSYGNVKDGSTSTYWAPGGSTGYVSVKWSGATTVSTVVIKQASGGGSIGAWRLLNGDSGSVLASGSGTPSTISFASTSVKKLTFDITSASGAPRIAEFESYAGNGGPAPTNTATSGPTSEPTSGPVPTSPSGTPTGAWPTSAGTERISGTVNVSGTFDGGMKTYCCVGDGGQGESQDPMFKIANGGTLQNVILGSPAGDGVHCEGTCTIRNVWWNDIGEDAATFKGTSGGTSYVIGGGARSGSDKTFQHNGNGTVSISGFYLKGSGKLYRGCGNCTSSYERHVKIDNVLLDSVKMVAGINTNWGDTATITRATLVNSSSATVCGKYKGVSKGSEPSYLGEGWNDANCKVSKSDITYR